MQQESTKHQCVDQTVSSRGLLGLLHATWPSVIIFIGLSLILASRTLYTSPDDDSYIAYFAGESSTFLTSIWSYLLEEPLWVLYASFMGNVFGPETALRITIFISSVLFLFACNKLSRGAWGFILLAFIMEYSLATLFYYIQIRTGLALSLFLMTIAVGLNPILAAVMASTIHSSFLVVIPCTILAYFAKKSIYHLFAILIMIIVSIYYLSNYIGVIDFGRRSEMSEIVKTTNAFFYVFAFLQYGMLLLGLKPTIADDKLKYWLHFSMIFFIFSLGLTFIQEAAVRLVFLSNVFVMILIGTNIKSSLGKIGALGWLLLLLYTIVMQFIRGDFGPDSWFTRWTLILT